MFISQFLLSSTDMEYSVYKIKKPFRHQYPVQIDRMFSDGETRHETMTWAEYIPLDKRREHTVGEWWNLIYSARYKHESLLASRWVVQVLLNYKQMVTFSGFVRFYIATLCCDFYLYFCIITESLDGWDWRGPLEITWSNPPCWSRAT